MKQQNDHNSPGWPLIMKISALLLLQLLKLKKIKCPYFLHHTSYNWDMNFLIFFISDYMSIIQSQTTMWKKVYISVKCCLIKIYGHIFFNFKRWRNKSVLIFIILYHPGDLLPFCCFMNISVVFMKIIDIHSQIPKWQIAHISVIWCLILKIR